MKLPRGFFFFLILVQAILFAGHFAVYAALVHFFPFASHHEGVLLGIFGALSVSFLLFTLADFRSESDALRVGYIGAAIWLPTWLYLLLAAALSIILEQISGPAGQAAAPWLFGVAAAVSCYGVINARRIRTITIEVPLEGLPEHWKGKTAVLATDLHLGHVLRYGFAGKVITHINKLKADIVFISGDFFDGVKTNFAELAKLFESLESRYGTYYVTGNHEEIAGYKVCEQAIAAAGIRVLENEMVDVEGLQVAGLAYHSESAETQERVASLIGSFPRDPARPMVLLKHVPNHAAFIASKGVDLQLYGHTHRGQVWPGRYITRRVYGVFDYGLRRSSGKFAYTSSGVGTWGPPVRTFTNSEIVRIIFR